MFQRHTQEFIDNEFEKKGWKNNSQYKNDCTKLDATCPRNHKCKISYNKFQQGRGCAICSQRKKPTYDEVKLIVESNGWKLISDSYTDAKTKMEMICQNDHINYKTLDAFKNKKQRCGKCWRNNNYGKNHKNWNIDRTRKDRYKYLQFSKYNIEILKDDINYNNCIINSNLYSIDHIFPRVAFIDNELDTFYDLKIIKKICNLRENLRIVLRSDNGAKGGKYNQNEFIKWFNLKMLEENNFVFH